jgi:sterol desaturase/sphingolipid hydroxylase (fatty acid hydroxylase superfamily)
MINSLDQSFSSLTGLESLLFVATLVSCWTAESICAKSDSQRKRRRACINGSFIIVALPIQLVMSGLCATVASYVTLHQLGLLYLIPLHANPVCKYGFMFILLDFLDYIYHYIMHHVPWLWRLHLVHHTDRRMDVSTTVREHPGETFVRNAFLIAWIILTGASLEILLARQGVETLSNILSHSSFRLPAAVARVLGWLLITPNLHHVHHHARLPYTDRNYGDVFSIWDRLFHTLSEFPASATEFGLDTHLPKTGDDHFLRGLAMPFDRLNA